MDWVISFAQEHMLSIIGLVAAGLLFFWDNIKQFISDLNKKTDKPILVVPDKIDKRKIEQIDQEAISHLRDRAVELSNKDLIDLLKQVDTIFFDIHAELGSK